MTYDPINVEENLTPVQNTIINFWVRLRTSFWYLYVFLGVCITWIALNKSGLVVWDNADLTYLNILLSVLAEVSAIVILVFTLRITERNERADERERHDISAIMAKLDTITSVTLAISEDVKEEDG